MITAEMPRDFIGYGRNPPKFEWPEGARLALNIVVNFEEGAERNPLDGDPLQEMASEVAYPSREGERETYTGVRLRVWQSRRDLPLHRSLRSIHG
jgi:allantoinase